MNQKTMGSIKIATISSTFLVLLFAIDSEELLSTIILAAIGAGVSFMISKLLEKAFGGKNKKRP